MTATTKINFQTKFNKHMTITGTITRILAKEQISDSFSKRRLHLKTSEEYPQDIEVEFVNDNIQKLDSFRQGDSVTIGINLRGREWVNPQGETKVFNTLQGWKIER